MRIMMLGWEFPPFIAGGLGTACYGLTKALDRLGHEVVFVLPKPVDRSHASHIRLLSPDEIRALNLGTLAKSNGRRPSVDEQWVRLPDGKVLPLASLPKEKIAEVLADAEGDYASPEFRHVLFRSVPAGFSSPYPAFSPGRTAVLARDQQGRLIDTFGNVIDEQMHGEGGEVDAISEAMGGRAVLPASESAAKGGAGVAYEGDMMVNAERYARLVVSLSRGEKFDVVHAHDWMTFPAGLALSRVSGKPLVVHVHSTEFDRAGEHVNQQVYDIERRGMHGAMRVIAVSELTRSICTSRYGIDAGKVDVVYNGIDSEAAQPRAGDRIEKKDKIVLFLGRITMQKGPEYFIRAAKRVLEKVPEAKFVVAGSGDMAVRMIEEAAWLGIGHRVLFTGFLRGSQVDRIYRMADCYVMPSVSEPFGIAPLEAMRNDVPVIISRQSGVSEVLTHALKVDFWDIDEMANKIIAVLRHPPLGATLREHGAFELRRLTWDGAAEKCVQSYEKARTGMRELAGV